MIICGLKLTHDGAVALIRDQKLITCVENEKVNGNRRFSPISNAHEVESILHRSGLSAECIDLYAIDGWDGIRESTVEFSSGGVPGKLEVAPYLERNRASIMSSSLHGGLLLGARARSYKSFSHVSGHIASAYCTSSFAKARLSALCLVWDGSIWPRLYVVSPERVDYVGSLFPLLGHAFAAAGHHFGPYRSSDRSQWNLDIAGKLMSYISLGKPSDEIISVIENSYRNIICRFSGYVTHATEMMHEPDEMLVYTHRFMEEISLSLEGVTGADVLCSFHVFIERMLIQRVAEILAGSGLPRGLNLCISGGCGLNIKWNSALRRSGLFGDVWVPPFPNDSGSAIGAACCALAEGRGLVPLEWSVFSGPQLGEETPPPEWIRSPCGFEELARVLAQGEPIVFLTGPAELGPRALGARSILAAATSAEMKEKLNNIKNRENFRPIAPICLQDRAEEIFDPGTPDPFMMFDHQTRPHWRDRIPGVVHLDGSARLQTIPRESSHPVARLLVEYERLTGVPLLCNTSANELGRGFFPDVASACRWGRICNVWSDGYIWKA
ncbi:carbamoyltransferase N-terminal domain-containing protein [Azorhizobium doebereinerae]|uniref:carbamoyltransferase N-terminal domain-containing protein n=1 Tax=Azorhizobium doebereinerae TaxID=281091 RepID=UPI0004090F10|nr:carbamoyltransferase N-terminal domain-containing protein [Azorhizobium doebereinerae]